MSEIPVSEDCLGLIIDEDEPDDFELRNAMRGALGGRGLALWRRADADVFTFSGRTLLIARPSPPILHRIPAGTRIIHRR